MNLGIMTRRSGADGVDDRRAKVSAVGDDGVRGEFGEVLVAEGDYFALGGKEGELVFAGWGEGRELDAWTEGLLCRLLLVGKVRGTCDFSAGAGGHLSDCGVGGYQFWHLRIGIMSSLMVLEWLEVGAFEGWVPCWQIMRILQAMSATQELQ